MTINKKVSVIIPFYNRLDWTVQSIDSVLKQTYTNFEIILVDDGSTEIINFPDYIKNDSRIKYFKLENSGPSRARNYGMTVSEGEYIAFLDSDDLFLPEKLEKQISFMEENDEVCFSHTSYILMDKNNSYIKTIDSGEFCGSVYPKIINSCPVATPTVMIRKDLANKFRFPETIRIGEDNIFWIQIARKYDIWGLIEPLTKVRKHDSNAAYDMGKLVEGRLNILNFSFEQDKTLSKGFKCKSYAIVRKIGKSDHPQNYLDNEGKVDNFLYLIRLIINRKYINPFVIYIAYPFLSSTYNLYKKIKKLKQNL